MPERIQRRRTKGWKMTEEAIYVGRPSRWGNPFTVRRGSVYGQNWTLTRGNFWTATLCEWDVVYVTSTSEAIAFDHSIALFRRLIAVQARDYPRCFEEWIGPLRGRDLACWCPLSSPCHADVLLEIANTPPGSDLMEHPDPMETNE